MAGKYTTVRHASLHNITGFIYSSDEGTFHAGIKADGDPGDDIEWYLAEDYADAESVVTEMLTECVRQITGTAQSPPSYQQPQPQYAHPQYQQQHVPQYQHPPQQYTYPPSQQYAPQPYVMTEADYARAERKARNKAVRQEMWDQFRETRRDTRAQKNLERACLKYPCPECSSGKWVKCVSIHGRNTLPAPHVSRIEQFQRHG